MPARYVRAGSDPFAALFGDFTVQAFRLETRQEYNEPEEDGPRRQFAAGEPVGDDPETVHWVAWLGKCRAAGRTVGRVHVVTEPVSDYIRFELAYYAPSAAAGEDIRILAVPAGGRVPGGLDEAGDFWLFDSARLFRLDYSPDGALIGGWLTTDPAEVGEACRWRDLAMAGAVPLAEYMAALAQAR
jgi:hypothetical protein